jgi:hypothetical protein
MKWKTSEFTSQNSSFLFLWFLAKVGNLKLQRCLFLRPVTFGSSLIGTICAICYLHCIALPNADIALGETSYKGTVIVVISYLFYLVSENLSEMPKSLVEVGYEEADTTGMLV